jgi:hypothetical protein
MDLPRFPRIPRQPVFLLLATRLGRRNGLRPKAHDEARLLPQLQVGSVQHLSELQDRGLVDIRLDDGRRPVNMVVFDSINAILHDLLTHSVRRKQ